jgi:hypothetical protein
MNRSDEVILVLRNIDLVELEIFKTVADHLVTGTTGALIAKPRTVRRSSSSGRESAPAWWLSSLTLSTSRYFPSGL